MIESKIETTSTTSYQSKTTCQNSRQSGMTSRRSCGHKFWDGRTYGHTDESHFYIPPSTSGDNKLKLNKQTNRDLIQKNFIKKNIGLNTMAHNIEEQSIFPKESNPINSLESFY